MALGRCVMAFDQCPPYGAQRRRSGVGLPRHQDWLEALCGRPQPCRPGPVRHRQGGLYPSADQSQGPVAAWNLPGIATAGSASAEPWRSMHRNRSPGHPVAAGHKPRYLMGIGSLPRNGDRRGPGDRPVRTASCRRLGRQPAFSRGRTLEPGGNAALRHDHTPLDGQLPCLACRATRRAYSAT